MTTRVVKAGRADDLGGRSGLMIGAGTVDPVTKNRIDVFLSDDKTIDEVQYCFVYTFLSKDGYSNKDLVEVVRLLLGADFIISGESKKSVIPFVPIFYQIRRHIELRMPNGTNVRAKVLEGDSYFVSKKLALGE